MSERQAAENAPADYRTEPHERGYDRVVSLRGVSVALIGLTVSTACCLVALRTGLTAQITGMVSLLARLVAPVCCPVALVSRGVSSIARGVSSIARLVSSIAGPRLIAAGIVLVTDATPIVAAVRWVDAGGECSAEYRVGDRRLREGVGQIQISVGLVWCGRSVVGSAGLTGGVTGPG